MSDRVPFKLDEKGMEILAEQTAAVNAFTPEQHEAVRRLCAATAMATMAVVNGEGPPGGAGMNYLTIVINLESKGERHSANVWADPSPYDRKHWGIEDRVRN